MRKFSNTCALTLSKYCREFAFSIVADGATEKSIKRLRRR